MFGGISLRFLRVTADTLRRRESASDFAVEPETGNSLTSNCVVKSFSQSSG